MRFFSSSIQLCSMTAITYVPILPSQPDKNGLVVMPSALNNPLHFLMLPTIQKSTPVAFLSLAPYL